MYVEQPRPTRLTKLSTLLLDGVDSPLQAVDLGHELLQTGWDVIEARGA